MSISVSSEQRREVLQAFARTLNREAHNLSRWPNLVWQQLYNRLQWDDEPALEILAPERARRSSAGCSPWSRTRTPYRESACMLRTLAGHTHYVRGCAVAPDQSFVVSASGDKTLKLWDPSTGTVLRTLAGHTDDVLGCAVAPDGSFVVSASEDKTLREVVP